MTGVILFRAQPLHNGHLNTIIKAYKDCKQTNSQLYIFVGSADKSGTKRNPIPIDYRLMLIKGVLHENFNSEDLKNIHTVPLEDMTDESDNSYSWGRYLFMKMLGHTKVMDMTIYYSDRPVIMLGWFVAQQRPTDTLSLGRDMSVHKRAARSVMNAWKNFKVGFLFFWYE